MAQSKFETNPWPTSPWLGESATAQFSLWKAGIEWESRSNWLSQMPIQPIAHDQNSSFLPVKPLKLNAPDYL
jgi:hypothetical protein